MTARSLHQFLAGFNLGDAISHEALLIRRFARARGLVSEIWCDPARVPPEWRGDIRDLARARAELGPDDAVLLHLSIGSPANELFATLPVRRAILYHNITPPEWFRGLRDSIARQLALGREQARALAGAAHVVLADSAFNAAELRAMGYARAEVFPLALDFEQILTPPDSRRLAEWADGRPVVLFVGRGAPNKRLEDLLAVFYYLQRYVEPTARLIHVGSWAGTELYLNCLRAKVREWGLRDVLFTGALPQAQLSAAYAAAGAFVCMSEHEGYCAPLIEAIAHDVPVVAYAAGAVEETLGGAGVLLRAKRFDLIAELLGRIFRDPVLREGILMRQRRRLAEVRRRDPAAELWAHLAPVLGPTG
ncbi:MAG: glycosyltransferase family 4 protein [Kiritimatiellae bacterium]|nr:glycosyltransferase family 4 protein [Kiritimatiellia bacterium]